MKLTPNDVEVLIHHAVSPEPHPRFLAPAVRDSIAMFIREGALSQQGDCRIAATAKGRTWLDAICSVPPPPEWGKVLKMAEAEYTPMGVEPIGTVEQALEVAHLLPENDPLRLDLLHSCSKRLIAAMQYVGFVTSKESQ